MDHQAELEKQKYRNWVRGGLAYKYLKQGIEGFADVIVRQEHDRFLRKINKTGKACNQCSLRSFRPKHKTTIMGKCRWGQLNCSCMYPKNKRPCPNGVCDEILEEILNCHGSQPPTPNWKNTDIKKWCSSPWEIAKCYINSPGYSDKTTASDIDAPGLLHVFINNINLHSHLSCAISGTDVFSKTLKMRNQIFHSATMELEDKELNDCLDDIIAILEDDKELKQRPDAKKAVEKLNQLKERSFIITANNEVEVSRDAMKSITNRSEELKQMIQDAKADLDKTKTEACEAIDDKTQKALDMTLKQLEKQSDNQLQSMKQAIELLNERMKHVEADSSALKKDIGSIKQRLVEIERTMEKLDTTRNIHQKQLEYVEQKKALQCSLAERYGKGYFKTWISPLKTQNNDLDINEVYVTPNMVVEKKTTDMSSDDLSKPVTIASSSASILPTHRLEENESAIIYQRLDMLDTGLARVTKLRLEENKLTSFGRNRDTFQTGILLTHRLEENKLASIDRYRDMFQTEGKRHKKIYIIGDAGTGKSSFSKMMIYNWCRAVKGDSEAKERTGEDSNENMQADNIREICKYNFLFTIPLQRMSGVSSDIREMIKATYSDLMTNELMDRIFTQEAESCLIIADGLDEWTPPKHAPSPQHVSSGIPVADGVKDATLVTLSRPSAKGILNIKLTEYDQKIKLLGVHEKSVDNFICKYMNKLNSNTETKIRDFMKTIKQANLVHLEETPLILQQLIWMYCTTDEIGTSVGDIYSNIVNIMFRWSEIKEVEDETESSTDTSREFNQMQLPKLLQRFPQCKENQKTLLVLGKLSFKAFAEDITSITFGRSELRRCGMSKNDIATLIRSGMLVEYNCFDPTYESTYLSFIHISYLEFFAAVYIASHYNEEYQTPQKAKLQSRTILEELFRKHKSAGDILQLSDLLKMICGLSPLLLEDISDLVSKNMISDEGMIRYRQELKDGYSLSLSKAIQIQKLIYECFSDCRTADKPAVSLCDVIIQDTYYMLFLEEFLSRNFDMSFIQKIVSNSVLSICMTCFFIPSKLVVERFRWIAKLPQLQCIRIDCITSCGICEELSSSLSSVVSLQQLTLENIICDRADCGGHAIDLSDHDQLYSIHIASCSYMLGSVLNAKRLQKVFISWSYDLRPSRISHVLCEHLSSSLSQAVSLQQLTLQEIICDRADCGGHAIDLPNHDQLYSIRIERCSCVLGPWLNAKNLQKLFISGYFCHRTSHVLCEHLSSSLSQAVSLQHITLQEIICDRADCEGHAINLPNHDQLYSIHKTRCSYMLGSLLNAKRLQKVFISWSGGCKISHVFYEHLSSSLSQAVSLQQLTLRDITCERADCGGHAIELPNHDQLYNIHIERCSCMLGSVLNAKSLQNVFISGSLSYRTSHVLCEHLSSLLSQAVSLKQLTLKDITCYRADCEGHAIDLTDHDQLYSISIERCSCMLGSWLNAKCLQNVLISWSVDRRPSHVLCQHLSSSLSQAVSLQQLTLQEIICDRVDCEGHAIVLPNHDQLYSIRIENCSCVLGSLLNAKSLQKVFISGSSDHRLSHVLCEHLSSSLSQAVSLQQLTLQEIICDRADCGGHAIDLHNHDQLYSIHIESCSCVLGTWLNAKNLQKVFISGSGDRRTSHVLCENLSSSLSQAESLQQLALQEIICDRADCGGHVIELPDHDQLCSIHIESCSYMLGSLLNAKSLQNVFISWNVDRRPSHVLYEHFSSSLSQAVSLHQLTLQSIICERANCGGHAIDLLDHGQLKSISIERCSCMLGSFLNAKSLQNVFISWNVDRRPSHVLYEHLSSSLSQAVSLQQLTLESIICEHADCGGHVIDLLDHDQLKSIRIERCSCMLGSLLTAKSLQKVFISGSFGRRTSHELCEHLSSSLSQAVSLKELSLEDINCDRADCKGHAIDLPDHDQLNSIHIESCSYMLGPLLSAKRLQ